MSSYNPGYRVLYLPETDSTSHYLTRLNATQYVEEFTVVRAGYQTAGKGQRGNSWESERGENLLFSILLKPQFLEARRQFLLSEAVALGIKEALDTYAEGFTIKWPNDIYRQDRKVCGTLLENDLMGSTIIMCVAGIGINVNQLMFHSDAPNPVSLRQITGQETDISALLDRVLRGIIDHYKLLKAGRTEEIGRKYHQALFRRDGMHRYRDANGEFRAEIARVEPEGTLVLMDDAGRERRYAFKEVQVVL